MSWQVSALWGTSPGLQRGCWRAVGGVAFRQQLFCSSITQRLAAVSFHQLLSPQLCPELQRTPAEAAEKEKVNKAEEDNYFEKLLQKTFLKFENHSLLKLTKLHAGLKKETSVIGKGLCFRYKMTNCHRSRSGWHKSPSRKSAGNTSPSCKGNAEEAVH